MHRRRSCRTSRRWLQPLGPRSRLTCRRARSRTSAYGRTRNTPSRSSRSSGLRAARPGPRLTPTWSRSPASAVPPSRCCSSWWRRPSASCAWLRCAAGWRQRRRRCCPSTPPRWPSRSSKMPARSWSSPPLSPWHWPCRTTWGWSSSGSGSTRRSWKRRCWSRRGQPWQTGTRTFVGSSSSTWQGLQSTRRCLETPPTLSSLPSIPKNEPHIVGEPRSGTLGMVHPKSLWGGEKHQDPIPGSTSCS